jgi:hypothetical protein
MSSMKMMAEIGTDEDKELALVKARKTIAAASKPAAPGKKNATKSVRQTR